jgi:hypothetical protein
MSQSFFYLSHDPVNENYVRRWVEERGGTLCPLSSIRRSDRWSRRSPDTRYRFEE